MTSRRWFGKLFWNFKAEQLIFMVNHAAGGKPNNYIHDRLIVVTKAIHICGTYCVRTPTQPVIQIPQEAKDTRGKFKLTI